MSQPYHFRDVSPSLEIISEYDEFRGSGRAVVIDNGSHECRIGWAGEATPRVVSRSNVGKLAGKSRNQDHAPWIAGNVAWGAGITSRYDVRSPLEGGVITDWDRQEALLDHGMSCLGIDSEGRVPHPIVMTEVYANLNHSRARLHELLFEGYGVPSLALGIDGMFSFRHNVSNGGGGGGGGGGSTRHALVISAGHHGTTVLPVVDGRLDPANGKRIDVGGMHCAQYIQTSLDLSHPDLRGAVTPERAEELLYKHVYVADDYSGELARWCDPAYCESQTHVFQLPYKAAADSVMTVAEWREKEKRREDNSRRMREMARAKQEATLLDLNRKAEWLSSQEERVRAIKEEEAETELAADEEEEEEEEESEAILEVLAESGVETLEELAELAESARVKAQAQADRLAGREPTPVVKPVPSYPLLDVPDAELDEAGLKAKRTQIFQKRMADGRVKAQAERAREAQKTRDENKEALRLHDLTAWLVWARGERASEARKLAELQRVRAELGDRRSKASRARARLRAQQAQDSEGDGSMRSRKRARKTEENFGMNDEDWDVYHKVNRDSGKATEEESAAEARLKELDTLIKQYAPQPVYTEADWKQRVDEVRRSYQVHLTIDRVRAPEIVFQPSIRGCDQAGLMETVALVLARYPPSVQMDMAQNVFITGGNSLIPGFCARVAAGIRQLRPQGTPIHVHQAGDPLYDAWRGASELAFDGVAFKAATMTRQRYEEAGPDYLQEHDLSNAFVVPEE